MAWSIDFISQANEVVRACEWAKADLTCPTVCFLMGHLALKVI